MDDSTLARDFAAGGEAAFAVVYETFRGPVFGIALHALADAGLAEEASQLAFLRLWRGRERYDPDRSLEAWLFSITRRAAIDVYRRERRLPVTTVAQERDIGVEALSVERLWEAWEVRRAVDALPAEEAEVVRLAHFYQLTHSEIAEHLGVPVGTVKSRSFRAHRRLAKAMSHLYEERVPAADLPTGGAR
jgi:RNA polymerase sigma-70 factor (ECF subfamily)